MTSPFRRPSRRCRSSSRNWPNDPAVENDCAYLNLLLYSDLEASRKTAEDLVAKYPANLPHRTTLALAHYRFHDPAAALDVYEHLNIDWNYVPPNALAVHAAVLALAGRLDDAENEASRIPLSSLREQERDLIQEAIGQ